MVQLPKKYFYTIGDVTKITGVKPHVLRYWEAQFKLLRPARRYSGHRKYTQGDLDLINRIRVLIVDKKFTLAGAKKEITKQMQGRLGGEISMESKKSAVDFDLIREVKKDVQECLDVLAAESKQQELLTI